MLGSMPSPAPHWGELAVEGCGGYLLASRQPVAHLLPGWRSRQKARAPAPEAGRAERSQENPSSALGPPERAKFLRPALGESLRDQSSSPIDPIRIVLGQTPRPANRSGWIENLGCPQAWWRLFVAGRGRKSRGIPAAAEYWRIHSARVSLAELLIAAGEVKRSASTCPSRTDRFRFGLGGEIIASASSDVPADCR